MTWNSIAMKVQHKSLREGTLRACSEPWEKADLSSVKISSLLITQVLLLDNWYVLDHSLASSGGGVCTSTSCPVHEAVGFGYKVDSQLASIPYTPEVGNRTLNRILLHA
jgi:hypothetical protein